VSPCLELPGWLSVHIGANSSMLDCTPHRGLPSKSGCSAWAPPAHFPASTTTKVFFRFLVSSYVLHLVILEAPVFACWSGSQVVGQPRTWWCILSDCFQRLTSLCQSRPLAMPASTAFLCLFIPSGWAPPEAAWFNATGRLAQTRSLERSPTKSFGCHFQGPRFTHWLSTPAL